MSESLREQAQRLLPGSAISADTKRLGRVGRPIPILHPGGENCGWFVPVAVGDQLAGFFRFLPDLTLLGYSEVLPAARTALANWCDPDTIRSRAEAFLKQPGKGEPPVLTYDGAPARIAWRVLFPGSGKSVYVVGSALYEAR